MHMDMIFVRQGAYCKGDDAFPLIRECFSLYSHEQADKRIPEIKRTDKGRPYFASGQKAEDAFDLSVTHSGDIWMCMISSGRCGIDFQYVRDTKERGIAERFFREGELAYIEGEGDFFDVWCRKEALGKYAGSGFFDDYPDTCPGGVPAGDLTIDGKTVFVRTISEEMLGEAGIHIYEPWRAAYVSESDEAPRVISI